VHPLLGRLLGFHWRRSGAALHEVDVAGCRIWYAEFDRRASASRMDRRAGKRARPRLPFGRGRRAEPAPPTAVLLHGLGGGAVSFHQVISALREGYRVVVPDLPGNGLSRGPAGGAGLSFGELLAVCEAFVARVAPEGAYLVGNSMGGWIAAKLAARRPDLTRGIALLNPGGPGLNAEDWWDFGQLLFAEAGTPIPELLARLFHRPPLVARVAGALVRRQLLAPSAQALVLSLTEGDFVSEAELSRVECPAVLVWGENDRLIPDGCRRFFLEKLPRVRYEPLPDCGHCPQIECPRRTAEILLSLPRMRRRRAPAAAAPRRARA
jgi:pimeloyl-ACP methyl ester carboxylesterase